MEKKNNVKATVAIDIRGFCAQCGIIITERNLEYPITGAGTDMDDGYHIILHKWLPEEQKRVTIASILAVCLGLKDRASCLMTECRDDDLSTAARRMLLPAKLFQAEYERLAFLGKALRLSALGVRFDVPLNEVCARVQELGLDN